ncbi:MAG: hypothetical protein AAFO94_14035, partial [Bacteroidota bacterium]
MRKLLLLLLLSVSFLLKAQSPDIEWQKFYGTAHSEGIESIQQLPDGGYIMVGTFFNYRTSYKVMRTDASGTSLWEKYYYGDNNDYLHSVGLTAAGGYVLGGYSNSGINNDKTQASYGGTDAWFIWLDADGTIIKDKTYGGDATERIASIQQTSDGGYVAGGTSFSGVSGMKSSANYGAGDYWIIKMDSLGNLLWEKSFGGDGEDELEHLQQTSDGGYILGGYTNSGISGNKTTATMGVIDYWIVKLDAAGNMEWQQSFGGNDMDFLLTLQQTDDGGYIMGGESLSPQSGHKTQDAILETGDFWVIKTDALGQLEWEKTIGGNGDDQLMTLVQSRDGGYLLGGQSDSGIYGDKTENNISSFDWWVVKLDACGAVQWDKTIGTALEDYISSVIETSDGGYLLGGHSGFFDNPAEDGFNNGAYDFYSVKLAGCAASYAEQNLSVCGAYSSPCGKIFDQSGSYQIALTNANGCDSLITLYLTVNEEPSDQIIPMGAGLMAVEDNATYQWINCADNLPVAGAFDQQFYPDQSGSYAVEISKNGCTQLSICESYQAAAVQLGATVFTNFHGVATALV